MGFIALLIVAIGGYILYSRICKLEKEIELEKAKKLKDGPPQK